MRILTFGEVRECLKNYSDWDEVMLRAGNRCLPLQLGLHSDKGDDWTSVDNLMTALEAGDDSNPFVFGFKAVVVLVNSPQRGTNCCDWLRGNCATRAPRGCSRIPAVLTSCPTTPSAKLMARPYIPQASRGTAALDNALVVA